MLLLGSNFLPQPLQTNTWPLCCQITCWWCIDKDVKFLVTGIIEVNPVSLSLTGGFFYAKGISTGFAGVWLWEVHKAVTNKKVLFCQNLYSKLGMMMGPCASLQCDCLTSYWQKEPCSRICRGRRPVPPSTSRLSYISSSSLIFPFISSSFSSFSFFSSSSSFFSSSSIFLHYPPPFLPPTASLESLQALPPRLQLPVGQALECLHTSLVSSCPQVQK